MPPIWYAVNAKTNGCGAFCFIATNPQSDIVGKAPFRRRTNVPPFVLAAVANSAGGRFAMTEEIWRPIPGYEGFYVASSLGRIASVDRILTMKTGIERKHKGQLLSGHRINSGYLRVILCRDGTQTQHTVHRLIATTFHGPPPTDEHEVNHIDCDKLNNRASNLEWVTPTRNVRHASVSGRTAKKLSPSDILEIRERYADGSISQQQLASEFGVNQTLIGFIVRGEIWDWIGGPVTRTGRGGSQ